MIKVFRKITALLVIVLLFLVNVTFAASEKRIEVEGGNYVTVSNVIEEKDVESYPLLSANAPVKVTFYGDILSLESISLSKTVRRNGTIEWSQEAAPVKFDVKKYTTYTLPGESKTVYDELIQETEDLPVYISGNYATLTKPGFYYVYAGPEAVVPSTILIEVIASGDTAVDNQPKSETKPSTTIEEAATATAAATASKVLVNGKQVSFEAYNINGSNYFKLRDLALAVNGTEKNFEVGWDGEKNAISLTSSSTYTPVGGELGVSANPTTKQATLSTAKVYLNSKDAQLTAYTIGGNNYFKLRDIAKALDVGIGWDSATSTIAIDTSNSYKE